MPYADPGVSFAGPGSPRVPRSTGYGIKNRHLIFQAPQAPAQFGPGAGGFDPRSNPYYQQMISQINASGLADASNTRAAIQQALIAFGLVPGGFKDQMGALDDTTRALIQKNTDTGISGYARLLEGKKLGLRDLVNRLQSRGLRRSGARGYGMRKNQLDFDRNFADAIAALLGQTSQAYSSYANNEFARQQAVSSALAQAFQNYYYSTPEASYGGSGSGSRFGAITGNRAPSGYGVGNLGAITGR